MNKLLDKIIRWFRLRPVLENLPLASGRILDVGCGPRPWFLYLDPKALSGRELFAVDQKAYHFESSLPFTFLYRDIRNGLPFGDGSFDLVTFLAVIEHLEHPESALAEIFRVLAPGGTLLITTPSRAAQPLLEFLAFRLHLIDEEEIADHKRYFTKRSLGALLDGAGFGVQSLRSFEFGFNLFAKAVKAR